MIVIIITIIIIAIRIAIITIVIIIILIITIVVINNNSSNNNKRFETYSKPELPACRSGSHAVLRDISERQRRRRPTMALQGLGV